MHAVAFYCNQNPGTSCIILKGSATANIRHFARSKSLCQCLTLSVTPEVKFDATQLMLLEVLTLTDT